MKKLVLTLAAVTALTIAPMAVAADYVGNSSSGKFHYTDCRWGKRIRADHRVYFETRDEAIEAGYTPCQVCQP